MRPSSTGQGTTQRTLSGSLLDFIAYSHTSAMNRPLPFLTDAPAIISRGARLFKGSTGENAVAAGPRRKGGGLQGRGIMADNWAAAPFTIAPAGESAWRARS